MRPLIPLVCFFFPLLLPPLADVKLPSTEDVDSLPWLAAALKQPIRMDGFVDVNSLPRSGYGRTGSGSPEGDYNNANAQLLPPPEWAGWQDQGQV